VEATVIESHPSPRDKISENPGNQDLAAPRQGQNPGRDVDGDAGELPLERLGLPHMEACPDLDPERPYGVTDGGSAANPIGRPVEGGEEPISRRVDLPSLELPQLAPDDLVMARQ